jgi:NADH pyrophosphatase NudC (nudix superfamily)
VVPWANVNGDWYFLMQAGYSSKMYDFKVDPLRGQKEPGETCWQTAVRECNEESGILR